MNLRLGLIEIGSDNMHSKSYVIVSEDGTINEKGDTLNDLAKNLKKRGGTQNITTVKENFIRVDPDPNMKTDKDEKSKPSMVTLIKKASDDELAALSRVM